MLETSSGLRRRRRRVRRYFSSLFSGRERAWIFLVYYWNFCLIMDENWWKRCCGVARVERDRERERTKGDGWWEREGEMKRSREESLEAFKYHNYNIQFFGGFPSSSSLLSMANSFLHPPNSITTLSFHELIIPSLSPLPDYAPPFFSPLPPSWFFVFGWDLQLKLV